jgi:outer membrane protein
MIKKIILIGLIFLPLTSFAQKAWTLEQCVDTAWNNNLKIRQQKNTAQNREINYRQARLNLLPNLNGSIGQNFVFGRSLTAANTYASSNSKQTSLNLSSNVTLFDGLRMKYNIDARKADWMASKADLEKIRKDIALSVATAYMQVLLNKELLQIANDQLALTKTKIEQRQALVSNGKMAEGEMYELQAQAAKEELSRTQNENALKLSLLDLAQIMEIDNFEQLDVVVPENLIDKNAMILSAQTIYESAITHRPEIKSAEYRLLSGSKDVLATKAELYPSLSFGANSGTGYYNMSGARNDAFGKQLRNNLTTSVGLTLSIPLFNKFDIQNRVKIAQNSVENSKLDIQNTKLEMKKSIQQAYYNALAAQTRWEAAQKSEIASQEAYRFANQKYEAGRASVYELYQAKSNLTQVLSEKTQSKYEYAFRVKILELLK